MALTGLATGVGQALPGLLGGGGGMPTMSGPINDRTAINVAPVGVNLGAILNPYNQGSTENGGYGLELLSRWAPTEAGIQTPYYGRKEPVPVAVYIAGAVGLALVYLMFKKGKKHAR